MEKNKASRDSHYKNHLMSSLCSPKTAGNALMFLLLCFAVLKLWVYLLFAFVTARFYNYSYGTGLLIVSE